MSSNVFRRIGICGVMAMGGMLSLLTGCSGSPPWGAWSKQPTPEQIQAVMGRPLETFIYFSRYDVYQNELTREYIYQENNEWVRSSAPPSRIAEAKLQASPFVTLSLRDGPDKSHTQAHNHYPADREKNPTLMASTP